MLLHGDELGRTQGGNNNAYCQDNEICLDGLGRCRRSRLVEFTAAVTALRARAPGVPPAPLLRGPADRRARRGRRALPDIAWFTPAGEEMTEQDWDTGFGRCSRVFLNGEGITEADEPRASRSRDDSFLLCFNAHDEAIEFTLPAAGVRQGWEIVVDTADGEVLTLDTVPSG